MKIAIYMLLSTVIISLIIQPIFAYSELEANLEFNQETLKPEEPFIANLILKNNLDIQRTVTIESLLKDNDGTYVNLLPPIYEEMKANEEKKIELYNFIVTDTFKEGTYLLKVRIIAQDNSIETKKELKITATLKDLIISLNSCKDKSCTERSKVFTSTEDIYMDYSSEVSEPGITATLTYPDKTIKQINLPMSIKAEQIGTYILSIKASKEGYKTLETVAQFAVIEKPAEIKQEQIICNNNLICEPEKKEHHGNCPKDCHSGSADNYCDEIEDGTCDPDCPQEQDIDCTTDKDDKSHLIYYIIAIIFVVLILFIAYRKIQEKKKWEELEREYSN